MAAAMARKFFSSKIRLAVYLPRVSPLSTTTPILAPGLIHWISAMTKQLKCVFLKNNKLREKDVYFVRIRFILYRKRILTNL